MGARLWRNYYYFFKLPLHVGLNFCTKIINNILFISVCYSAFVTALASPATDGALVHVPPAALDW